VAGIMLMCGWLSDDAFAYQAIRIQVNTLDGHMPSCD